MGDPILPGNFDVRSETEGDREFLFQLYASTRQEEIAMTGWNMSEVNDFLNMQFTLQHSQYLMRFPLALRQIILVEGKPAGRLYFHREKERITVIDISLIPEFRNRGIGGAILRKLAEEADENGLVMDLHVDWNNPIRWFYKTLGFHEKESHGFYCYMERPVRTANGNVLNL